MNNSEVNQLHKLLIERSVGEQADMKKRLIHQRFNKISLCCNKEQTVFFDVKNGGLWVIFKDGYENNDSKLFLVQWKGANNEQIIRFSQLPFMEEKRGILLNQVLKIIKDQ